MITNDIQKVTKNDETVKEVIQNVQREVVEVKEAEPVQIKTTEFEKTTEYVVKFESPAATPEEKPVIQEVTIIHDKVDHSNNVVAVEKVPEPQVE